MASEIIHRTDADWDEAMHVFDCQDCGGQGALARSDTSRHVAPFPSHEECPECVGGLVPRACDWCGTEIFPEDAVAFDWNGRRGWPLCAKCAKEK